MAVQQPINIPLVSLAIARKLYAHACIKADVDLPRYLPRVEKFLQGQINEDGLIHDCSRFKLLELAFLLEQFQPQSILELGGGGTTSVFAEYAARSEQKIQCVSVDESQHYQDLTREKLDPAIRDSIDFQCCEKIIVEKTEGVPDCHYATDYLNWFSEGVDFVYVDGPSNKYSDKEYMACIDNILLVKGGVIPKVIAYDLRAHSIWAFEKEPEYLWYDTKRWHGTLKNEDLIWFVDKPFHHSLQTLRTQGTRLGP